jgi:uncharacterized glyoxalase superfamily protein PhnB
MSNDNLSHHATILPTNNIEAGLEFYTNKLGFECTFQWEKPPTYVVLKRGGVSLHLALQDVLVDAQHHVKAYVFCQDIELIFQELQNKGVKFENEINDADYGMREFVLIDPSGHRIVFGQELG